MLGCDIIEMDRVRTALERFDDRFAQRILSAREMSVFTERGRNLTFLAGRFAAKESIAKSLKTGIGHAVAFTDIEVLPGESGEPVVFVRGVPRPDISVSISHCRDYAMAVSMIERAT